MKINISPWIDQLNRVREAVPLSSNRKTDIAIVGAGIAGISTAYFILKNTNFSVFLVEGDKVAHGATGHNAGQVVSYFERQLSSLVSEYGLEMAIEGQIAIDSAWDLLDSIYKEASLVTPCTKFVGYAGCQDIEEVIIHLENNIYSQNPKINKEPLMVAKEKNFSIPNKYKGLYTIVPHSQILSLLETNDRSFIAALSAKKGVLNSALFCEELLDYMLRFYPDRITLFEESHVKEVVLKSNEAVLKIRDNQVNCKKVVLCTNGFERFGITNLDGENINTKFHHLVRGSVGYMAAYLDDNIRTPTAISYLPKHSETYTTSDNIPYFYLTRRIHETENITKKNLICVGGPETRMDDTNGYKKEHPYPSEAQATIDKFLHTSFKYAPQGEINYKYKWHGLMGYTPNGVRCIGPEPINPVLLYNLGCNGVGILPSIYGGKKISQFLKGENLPSSIFDPQDSRIQ